MNSSSKQRALRTKQGGAANKPINLALQGGGAHGAFAWGVMDKLIEDGRLIIDGISGTSAGSMNAVVYAYGRTTGGADGAREALEKFWKAVSDSGQRYSVVKQMFQNPFSFGAEKNFSNASPSPSFEAMKFMTDSFSPYQLNPTNWNPLLDLLNGQIDFDRLNQCKETKLFLSATNVRSGKVRVFNTHEITASAVMASSCLPNLFQAVEIDGEHYWDGGLVSNTPLQYVLDQPGKRRRVVFQVDLFAATGAMPATLAEVTEREKDIRFSSRTRLNTTMELDRQVIAQAAQRLIAKLPPALRDDPDVRALSRVRSESAIDVVHLIYRSKHYESQSKDYEFSRLSMQEHWDTGRADMAHTLHDPRWVQRERSTTGVHVFDLTSDGPAAKPTIT